VHSEQAIEIAALPSVIDALPLAACASAPTLPRREFIFHRSYTDLWPRQLSY